MMLLSLPPVKPAPIKANFKFGRRCRRRDVRVCDGVRAGLRGRFVAAMTLAQGVGGRVVVELS